MTHFDRADPQGSFTFEDFTIGMTYLRRATLADSDPSDTRFPAPLLEAGAETMAV